MPLNRLAVIAAMTVLGGGKPCIRCGLDVDPGLVVCHECYMRADHQAWIKPRFAGRLPVPAWARRVYPTWVNWETMILIPDEDD